MSCHHFDTDVSFFRELLVNTQDNLIMVAAANQRHFQFCDLLVQPKVQCIIEKLNVAKISENVFH